MPGKTRTLARMRPEHLEARRRAEGYIGAMSCSDVLDVHSTGSRGHRQASRRHVLRDS
jgi:hypothetical protein